MLKDQRNLLLIPAALLVLAVFPWPYDYYQFLRVVVCFVAGLLAFIAYDRNKEFTGWFYVWLCISIMFNPFLPIHLNRAIWFFLDLGTAVVFGYRWLVLRSET